MANDTVYYNTTGLAGQELMQATEEAYSQDKKVLAFLKENSKFRFTTEQICKYMKEGGYLPDTTKESSITRAVNTLTNAGLITKAERAKNDTGRTAYTYRIVE